jgi:thioredoxin reductase (NADPH)
MLENVVIIGSGPAGWTAAIYAARSRLSPLVYEGASPLGQLNLTTEVENFPGWPFVDTAALAQFSKSSLLPERMYNVGHLYDDETAHHGKRSVTGPELMEYMRQQALNFETRIITDEIVKVDFQRHPFLLTSAGGDTIEALSVIVATGARANWLNLPSEEKFKIGGVSACATCDGALPRYKDRPIVVVGGGDTAMEETNHLTKFGSKIYLVHRRDAFRASPIMQKRVLDNPKVEVKWNSVVDEVLGTPKDGVTGVRIKSTKDSRTEELAASGMFVAIGHTPNTDFLGGQLALEPGGYIKWTTPQRTFTSVEGVFAAGDVADSYYRQAVTAAGTGCMAALDAERWLAAKGHH